MKKFRLLLTLSAVALCSFTAMADDIDNTFVFVDEAGNIIEDGTVLTRRGLTDESEYVDPYISAGLYVLNTTDERIGASMAVDVKTMDSGALSCCFPMQCATINSTGSYETDKGMLEANENKSMNTEYTPLTYGTCTATFQIKVYEAGLLLPGDFIANGPSITINFIYDETSAGIDSVNANGSEVVGYYTLDGKQLDAPQAGVIVVKYADGTSVKTIVK